jgi:hypothetical protein
MYVHTGLLDDRPKGRELFWIAQLKRAARIHAELRMQTGAPIGWLANNLQLGQPASLRSYLCRLQQTINQQTTA